MKKGRFLRPFLLFRLRVRFNRVVFSFEHLLKGNSDVKLALFASIYKPSVGRIPPKARRFVASNMALIETADHLFCETMRLLEEENRPRKEPWKGLEALYVSHVGETEIGYDEKLNLAVIDALSGYESTTTIDEIDSLLKGRHVLLGKIQKRVKTDPFWAQPTSLLAYWLVRKDSMHAFDVWPFASAREALQLVYSDLGESLPHWGATQRLDHVGRAAIHPCGDRAVGVGQQPACVLERCGIAGTSHADRAR
jgi:hypothetical protein